MASLTSTSRGYCTLDVESPARPQASTPSKGKFAAHLAALAAVFALGTVTAQYDSLQAASLAIAPTPLRTVGPSVAPPSAPARPPAPRFDPLRELNAGEAAEGDSAWGPATMAAGVAAGQLLGPVGEASASLAQGRTAALLHPASMAGMLALSLWAGWLGLQWKRARTIGQEITEAKTQLEEATKKVAEGAGDAAAAVAELTQRVEALQAERKALTAGNFRDRHFNAGSLILAVGVSSAVVGPINTYIRTGKLFPGPHLYVGAAMVSLWAVAAGLVPAMQKGNETARSVHVALNAINTLFFIWQVGTGLEILLKVWQFTSWP